MLGSSNRRHGRPRGSGWRITNVETNRLRDHKREGWRVLAQLPCSGEDAYEAEQAILRWWREELGEEAFLAAGDMPQGAWSETVSMGAVEADDTVGLMKDVSEVPPVVNNGSHLLIWEAGGLSIRATSRWLR